MRGWEVGRFYNLSQPSNLSSTLAICAWIPLFALRCEEERRSALAAKPTALLAPDDARRLWQVSQIARRFGVKPGMTVNQSIGLCPTLILCEPDPVYYDALFTQLLSALHNVSPVIEPAELGRAYLGADGIERLYGSPTQQLQAVIRAAQQKTGITTHMRLGWGYGKFVSWVAATRAKPGSPVVVKQENGAEFLATQPIACLPIDSDSHHRLRQLGISTLGDLARLPEPAIVSQFGREGKLAWWLAAGFTVEPVRGRKTPDPVVELVDFPTPIVDYGLLTNALARLLERALQHPQRIGWRVQAVRVSADLEQGASWMLDMSLKNPTANCDSILDSIKTRIQQVPLTGAVASLKVEFTRFARGTDELQLFARDATSAARAGQRRALRWAAHEIKTRLKHSLLYHIIEITPWSRIPERRYALIDYDP